MTALELWRYSAHLTHQEQAAQRYQVQFWKKALYPFACIVMVALALPFAYLHARAGSVSFKVFAGIMIGILFHFMNGLFSHLGLLNTWPPWASAGIPSLVALAVALAMLRWIDRVG